MPYDDVTSAGEVRRFEVFTGAGPRRRWSTADKARIIAESYSGVGTVCDVARRHGLAPTQLFTWRREARQLQQGSSEAMFAPVMLESPALPTIGRAADPKPRSKKTGREPTGGIELEIDGVVMRIGRGAEAKTVAAVIKALKAER